MGGLDLHLSIVMLCLAAGTSCLEVPCAALQEVRPGWSWLAALAGDHGGSSSMDPRWRRGRRIGTGTMAFASPPVLGSHGGGLQLGALKVPRQAPAGGYLHRRGMEGMAKHWHSRAYQGPRPTAMCEQGEGGDGRKKKGDDADEDEDTFVDKLFKPLVRKYATLGEETQKILAAVYQSVYFMLCLYVGVVMVRAYKAWYLGGGGSTF